MASPAAEAPELPPLVPPTSTTGLLEVFRRRYLLRLLVRREINARYSGSFLGLIWSYINPLSQFFIFWFVMGQIVGLAGRTENFAIHVFAAFTVVHFFIETVNAGTRSIVRNRQVIQKMAVPREMFPVASMLVSAFHVVPQLVILLVACLVSGWRPDAMGMLAALIAVAMVGMLATALALMLSVANVFLRDVSNAVNVLSNFVRFSVPMIYPYTLVQARFGDAAHYYLWNPIADAVLLMQRAFWVGSTDDPDATIAVHLPAHLFTIGTAALAGAAVLLVLAQMIFWRFESKIPERL